MDRPFENKTRLVSMQQALETHLKTSKDEFPEDKQHVLAVARAIASTVAYDYLEKLELTTAQVVEDYYREMDRKYGQNSGMQDYTESEKVILGKKLHACSQVTERRSQYVQQLANDNGIQSEAALTSINRMLSATEPKMEYAAAIMRN